MRVNDYYNRGIGAATSDDSTLGLRNIQVRGQIKMWGSTFLKLALLGELTPTHERTLRNQRIEALAAMQETKHDIGIAQSHPSHTVLSPSVKMGLLETGGGRVVLYNCGRPWWAFDALHFLYAAASNLDISPACWQDYLHKELQESRELVAERLTSLSKLFSAGILRSDVQRYGSRHCGRLAPSTRSHSQFCRSLLSPNRNLFYLGGLSKYQFILRMDADVHQTVHHQIAWLG